MRKWIPFLMLLAGVLLLLYPSLSRLFSQRQQISALTAYRAGVRRLAAEERDRRLAAAEAENAAIHLEVDASGIIGSVAIPALQTELPIYAGTGEIALTLGVGLLEGSALPLGGAGRHTVLAAHRGLPESRLFRDLDRLVPGDCFTVTVLGRTLTYRVEQLLTVEPEDTAALLPVPGEDLCTLVTCTPYGIHSHRLLVRGRRS